MSLVHESLSWLEPAIAAHGALVLFLILYGESFGLPLPGESGLIAASLLAAHGDLHIASVFLAAWSGAVLGDSTGYLIGRWGGRYVLRRYGGLLHLTPERLDSLEKTAREKGFMVVLTARFVVVLRQLNGIVAGSVGMPWPHFVAANSIGAGLWAGVWSFGPYLFTDWFRRFL